MKIIFIQVPLLVLIQMLISDIQSMNLRPCKSSFIHQILDQFGIQIVSTKKCAHLVWLLFLTWSQKSSSATFLSFMAWGNSVPRFACPPKYLSIDELKQSALLRVLRNQGGGQFLMRKDLLFCKSFNSLKINQRLVLSVDDLACETKNINKLTLRCINFRAKTEHWNLKVLFCYLGWTSKYFVYFHLKRCMEYIFDACSLRVQASELLCIEERFRECFQTLRWSFVLNQLYCVLSYFEKEEKVKMSRENDENQGKRNVESIRTEHESFESEVKRLKT